MVFLLRLTLLIVFIWTCLSIYFIGDGKISSSSSAMVSLVNGLAFLIELITILVIIGNSKIILRNSIVRIIFLWAIYLSLNIFLTSENIFSDLRIIYWWPCGFILFYCIFLNINKSKILVTLRYWVLGILSAVTFLFLLVRFGGLNASLLEVGTSASNEIFFLVTLSPFLFFLKRKLIKYVFFTVIIIATIVSLKRSALIIVFLVMMLSLYYDYVVYSKGQFISRLLLIISIGMSSALIFNYFNEQMGNSMLGRISSIQEDKGSGRLDIYEIVLDKYSLLPIESKLIGVGHDGVRRSQIVWDTKGDINPFVSAHNDFIEVLYDYGIFGLIIYLMFIIQIIKNTILLRKTSKLLYSANLSGLIIFFVMSMVSHLIIYPTYFFFLSMLWGLSAAMLNKTNKMTFYEN